MRFEVRSHIWQKVCVFPPGCFVVLQHVEGGTSPLYVSAKAWFMFAQPGKVFMVEYIWGLLFRYCDHMGAYLRSVWLCKAIKC